jgi:ADP-ribose pyrophosphatase YjhB (NUDIX family)
LFAWLWKAKFTHGAIVIVHNADGELLLVHERLRERGSWGLPGGFMRMRESPRQAAVRELHEEVGLDVAESALEPVEEYRQPWAWHYDHLFSLTCAPDNAKGGTSMELQAQAWFAPDNLPPLTRAADYALRRNGLPTVAYQPSADT